MTPTGFEIALTVDSGYDRRMRGNGFPRERKCGEFDPTRSTVLDNCEMLCVTHNRAKGNR